MLKIVDTKLRECWGNKQLSVEMCYSTEGYKRLFEISMMYAALAELLPDPIVTTFEEHYDVEVIDNEWGTHVIISPEDSVYMPDPRYSDEALAFSNMFEKAALRAKRHVSARIVREVLSQAKEQ
jgi:hypothetical protein